MSIHQLISIPIVEVRFVTALLQPVAIPTLQLVAVPTAQLVAAVAVAVVALVTTTMIVHHAMMMAELGGLLSVG